MRVSASRPNAWQLQHPKQPKPTTHAHVGVVTHCIAWALVLAGLRCDALPKVLRFTGLAHGNGCAWGPQGNGSMGSQGEGPKWGQWGSGCSHAIPIQHHDQ